MPYDIFRRDSPIHRPIWIKEEDDLDAAKRVATRLAAKSHKRHFVLNLSTCILMYETEPLQTPNPENSH
jgi:hypothetical protein